MAESMNHHSELVDRGEFLNGMGSYGHLMVGDKAFEFYDEKVAKNYIQIHWDEVDFLSAEVIFNRWIPRFAFHTKQNGVFRFAARHPKKVLRAVRNHMDPNKMLRSLSVWDVIKRSVRQAIHRRQK